MARNRENTLQTGRDSQASTHADTDARQWDRERSQGDQKVDLRVLWGPGVSREFHLIFIVIVFLLPTNIAVFLVILCLQNLAGSEAK